MGTAATSCAYGPRMAGRTHGLGCPSTEIIRGSALPSVGPLLKAEFQSRGRISKTVLGQLLTNAEKNENMRTN
jgi:hypothetical protein